MKRIVLMLIAAFRLWSSDAVAQETLKGRGDLRVEFDMARYYGDTNRVFVELYYGIHENALTYVQESGQYRGTANMKYTVRNDSGIVATKQWTVPHSLEDSTRLPMNRILTGLESVVLSSGKYTITLVTFDVNNPTRQDSMTMVFPVALFPKDREIFSDIELCTSIQSSSDQQSVFYKNTLEVVPNAGRLFGTGLPIMYYYVEVYSLSSAQVQSSMTIHTAVVDATGKEILSRDKLKPRLHDASVEIGTMNLSALRSGTYLFRISLVDSSNASPASTSKKFFIYKLGSQPDTLAAGISEFTSSEYSFMSQADLDKEFAYAKYIATEHERTQFEMLTDVKAKQQFMFEFWQRRNPEPGTNENVFKKEYFRRVETANRNFSTGMREGWKTDRGRILIQYGQYDEIERNPSTAESNPYEMWRYNNMQGGVIFVFVDKNGMNDYVLVHSTHRDELHDENWYRTNALKAN